MPSASERVMRKISYHVYMNPGCRISEVMDALNISYAEVKQALFIPIIEDQSKIPPSRLFSLGLED